jgi:SSS family solute:Na+ symporter
MATRLFGRGTQTADSDAERDVHSDRLYTVVLGIAVIVIAALLNDVVNALTIAYDILVGGLLVPILGGFLWKRATGIGALSAMAAGTVVTLGSMAIYGVAANEPIYYGLGASLIAYIAGSLLSPRTPANVLEVWDNRLAGRDTATVEPTGVVLDT